MYTVHTSFMCIRVFVFDRESFYIYVRVQRRYKSCTGLLHRGGTHQKCHFSAICHWLKLCNCNSAVSAPTPRLNKFHSYTQTHQDKCSLCWDKEQKEEYLALKEPPGKYGGREISTRCNIRKHVQKDKIQANS